MLSYNEVDDSGTHLTKLLYAMGVFGMYAVGALTWAVIVSIDQNTRTLINIYAILDTRLSQQFTSPMP